MGCENVFHCEWNPFGQKILKHYWPKAESFNDITKSDFTKYANTIDILTGGFPCQPYSSAGQRKGKEDERHLWPHMLRAIQEISPRYIVGENVRGLLNWNGGMVFNEVCVDLENNGYQVAPVLIPACGVGAPHRRERIWFVATNPVNEGLQRGEFNGTFDRGKPNCDESHDTIAKLYQIPHWDGFPTEPPVCGRNDGISRELDGITFSKWRTESIKALGNAVVPQVAFEIFKAIQQCDDTML